MKEAAIFDINDSKEFFESIVRTYIRYRRGVVRSTEDILYVIMGLNHLREWIAPGYKMKNGEWPKPQNEREAFSRKVYEVEHHQLVRRLCNAMKHVGGSVETSTDHEALFDDWEDIDSVAEWDLGPPTGHSVDGAPIEGIIDPLIELYAIWFWPNLKAEEERIPESP